MTNRRVLILTVGLAAALAAPAGAAPRKARPAPAKKAAAHPAPALPAVRALTLEPAAATQDPALERAGAATVASPVVERTVVPRQVESGVEERHRVARLNWG